MLVLTSLVLILVLHHSAGYHKNCFKTFVYQTAISSIHFFNCVSGRALLKWFLLGSWESGCSSPRLCVRMTSCISWWLVFLARIIIDLVWSVTHYHIENIQCLVTAASIFFNYFFSFIIYTSLHILWKHAGFTPVYSDIISLHKKTSTWYLFANYNLPYKVGKISLYSNKRVSKSCRRKEEAECSTKGEPWMWLIQESIISSPTGYPNMNPKGTRNTRTHTHSIISSSCSDVHRCSPVLLLFWLEPICTAVWMKYTVE